MAQAEPGDAVIQFAQNGVYPDSDDLVRADVDVASLSSVRKRLRKAREATENEIEGVSCDIAPDVDEWIRRAKQLQADIEQSRATAQEVVNKATEAAQLQAKHHDASEKARLLREEAAFNTRLQDYADQIRAAAAQFREADSLAQSGRVEASLHRLQELELVLEELHVLQNTNAIELLRQRVEDLRGSLIEQANKLWGQAITVDIATTSLTVRRAVKPATSDGDITTADVVRICASLNLVEANSIRLARDLQCGLLMPLLSMEDRHERSVIETSSETMIVSRSSEDRGFAAILDQIRTVVDFIHERMPPSVNETLSRMLLPGLVSRLQSRELSASIPTSLGHISQYQDLLQRISAFSDHLASKGWNATEDLKEWTSQAPKLWLSSRKDASIAKVRVLLSTRLSESKIVERVETQVVSSDDVIAGADGDAKDDWGAEWGDPPTQAQTANPSPPEEIEEEDMGVWDEEETPEDSTNRNGDEQVTHGDDDWGWGSEPAQAQSSASASSKQEAKRSTPSALPQANGTNAHSAAKQKSVTLRETYCATALPDALLEVITQLTSDASQLASGDSALSVVSPAANGLYAVPTLILAAYRALAPTRYELLPGGLMLLYNDSTCLATGLNELSKKLAETGSVAMSRLKLAADIDLLNSFARRAYGRAMDAQRTITRDLIDNAQGFANCTIQPYSSACDEAVAATVAHVHAIANEWKSILSRSALLQSLGSILAAVIGKIIVDIEEMSDIGDEESSRLRGFCEEIGKLNGLFAEDPPDSASPNDEAGKRYSTALYAHNWIKFQYLMELLDSNLADIKYLWAESGLKAQFEAEEVVDLIEALFADNDHRRRAIAEVRR